MLHKTRAIVLRTVPYGDTSLIVSAYTETFGLQQYLVKGARKTSRKGANQSLYLQPAAVLDMVVYHNELKQLQLVKEMKWGLIYDHVFSDVIKYAVALFMVEMLTKCVRQPEVNPELYQFFDSSLTILDAAETAVTANFPLHFLLQLAGQLGFQLEDNFAEDRTILDLQDGRFVPGYPQHSLYLEGKLSAYTMQLLQTDSPVTLYRLKINQATRRELLAGYLRFFEYHIADFGRLKTLKVLEELLN